jgi:hypothetical protein
MAYGETLSVRIREVFSRKKIIDMKTMLGGIGFVLKGNMLVVYSGL